MHFIRADVPFGVYNVFVALLGETTVTLHV